jgi:hypothetical protein
MNTVIHILHYILRETSVYSILQHSLPRVKYRTGEQRGHYRLLITLLPTL